MKEENEYIPFTTLKDDTNVILIKETLLPLLEPVERMNFFSKAIHKRAQKLVVKEGIRMKYALKAVLNGFQELFGDDAWFLLAKLKMMSVIELIPDPHWTMTFLPVKTQEDDIKLMQLVILTGITEEELKDFRFEISKMMPSERFSFINEVIKQETIKRARIENKTPEEVLRDIEFDARMMVN